MLALLFQKLKQVTEQGLMAYSGLCLGLGKRVNVKQMGTYLLHALDSDEEDCARIACGIISDIASALQDLVE